MSAIIFTTHKYLTPSERTVEVYGEISIGDESIEIGSDVTVEFDEEEHEVKIDEEDIDELYPREARLLLNALWVHQIKPALEAVAAAANETERTAIEQIQAERELNEALTGTRLAITAMKEVLEMAENLSKEGAE